MPQSDVSKMVNEFLHTIAVKSVTPYFNATRDYVNNSTDDVEICLDLRNTIKSVGKSLDVVDPWEDYVVSGLCETLFFKSICEQFHDNKKYTLTAVKIYVDPLFNAKSLGPSFFKEVGEFLMHKGVHDFKVMQILPVPFNFCFNHYLPIIRFKKLADFLIKASIDSNLQRLSESVVPQLFTDYADLVEAYRGECDYFWLPLVGISEKTDEFDLEVQFMEQLNSEGVEINTQVEDEYLESRYGIQIGHLMLNNLLDNLIQDHEENLRFDFLEELINIVQDKGSKNPKFLMELTRIKTLAPGMAEVLFYSEDFEEEIISLNYFYSPWLPDKMITNGIVASIQAFLDDEPRYANFIELPDLS